MTLKITFETGKAIIKDSNYTSLDVVAERMQAFPKSTVIIEGHTDNVGSAASNQKLSQQRADAIVKYLSGTKGVNAKRLSAKGYGLTKPVDSNKTEEGRRNNRRVEAVFTCPE
jgi:OOP family OmpA-OmpF porin